MHNGYEEPQGSMGNSMMVFLLGAAIGATVAILYAPASGESTRARIAEKANDVKEKAGVWKEKAVDQAGEWKEKVATGAQNALDRVSDAIKPASNRVNSLQD